MEKRELTSSAPDPQMICGECLGSGRGSGRILYHGTTREALPRILREGLRPPHPDWCIYLSPRLETARHFGRGVVLEVDVPEGARLTVVDEECAAWEVLCWGAIPPDRIRVLEGGDQLEVVEVLIEKRCEWCGAELVVKRNRKTGTEFLGCLRWPECSYREPVPESIKLRLPGAPVLPGME